MYNEKVIRNFVNPHNAGGLHGANAVAKVGQACTSDIVKLYIKINEEEMIEDARFKTFGSAAAIACSNIACDMLKGRSAEDAEKLTSEDIIIALGDLPIEKTYCASTVVTAIKNSISNYRIEKEKELLKAEKKNKKLEKNK